MSTVYMLADQQAHAGSLTFAPSFGWIFAGITLSVLLLFFIIEIRRYVSHPTHCDETAGMCIRRCLILILLAICTISPSFMTATRHRVLSTTNVIFLLDTTGSMNVYDAKRNGSKQRISRLQAAQHVITDLTKSYAQCSFAALRFGASTSLDVPLTPDTHAITNWVASLRSESTNTSVGSSLDAPIDKTLLTLKAIHSAHPNDHTILYLITDGEETAERTRRTFSSLRAYLTHAVVIGVGSSEGGKIPQLSDQSQRNNLNTVDEHQWVLDPATGKPGISKLDEKNLRAIADELSGTYMREYDQDRLKQHAKALIAQQWREGNTPKPRLRPEPVVWPFALVATILLFWEFIAWVMTSRRLIS